MSRKQKENQVPLQQQPSVNEQEQKVTVSISTMFNAMGRTLEHALKKFNNAMIQYEDVIKAQNVKINELQAKFVMGVEGVTLIDKNVKLNSAWIKKHTEITSMQIKQMEKLFTKVGINGESTIN